MADTMIRQETVTDHDGVMQATRFGGWLLPAGERHLPEWMQGKHREEVFGRLTYQFNKIKKIDGWVPDDRRRCAIDVGAHVGLWAVHLATWFEEVFAFEAKRDHFRLLNMNLKEQRISNVRAICMALGAAPGRVDLTTGPSSSGDTTVAGPGSQVNMNPLDAFSFPLVVDLIKIDVEGYEEPILRGAQETLERCQPYVIVEQKGHEVTHQKLDRLGAVTLLKDMGWREDFAMSGDYFMSPPT